MPETTPSMEQLCSAAFDANVRMEAAWPFPTENAPEGLADAFANLDIDNIPAPLKSLVANWPEDRLDALFEGDHREFHDAWEDLSSAAFRQNIYGWIGVAATPVITATSPTSASFSWGYYYTRVLFAPGGDALFKAAIDWAVVQRDKAYAAFKRGKANG